MTSSLLPITGTANVTQDQTAVQVVGMVLSGLNCVQGAQVFLGGAGYFVSSDGPTDTTHFALERPYEGATGTVSCSIGQVTPEMTSRIALNRTIQSYDASAQLIAANSAGYSYAYSGSTAAPISGQVALDNAAPSAAAKIRLSKADLSGQSMADRLGLIAIGDELTLRAIDGSARATFLATAAGVDEGSYVEVPASYVGAAGVLAAGSQVVIERLPAGQSPIKTGSTGNVDGAVLVANGTAGNSLRGSSVTIDGAGNVVASGQLSSISSSPGVGLVRTGAGSTGIVASALGKTILQLILDDGSAHTGGNAGSDLVVNQFNDAGGYLRTALYIRRSDGMVQTSGLINNTFGQMAFPATENPASGANVLDDYEEGNFNGLLEFGGSFAGVTYSTNVGGYIKTGRSVEINATLMLSATGTATGNATIIGLPFVSGSIGAVGGAWALSAGFCSHFSGGISPSLTFNLADSSTTVTIFYNGNTSGVEQALINSNFQSNTNIQASGGYFASV